MLRRTTLCKCEKDTDSCYFCISLRFSIAS